MGLRWLSLEKVVTPRRLRLAKVSFSYASLHRKCSETKRNSFINMYRYFLSVRVYTKKIPTNSSSFYCILYGLVYIKTLSAYSCCSYNFEPSQQLIACVIEFVCHLSFSINWKRIWINLKTSINFYHTSCTNTEKNPIEFTNLWI